MLNRLDRATALAAGAVGTVLAGITLGAGWYRTSAMAVGFGSSLLVAAATQALRYGTSRWAVSAGLGASAVIALTVAAAWQLPELAVREAELRAPGRVHTVDAASRWDQQFRVATELAKVKEEARRTALTAVAGVVAFLSWFTTWYLKRDELEHQRAVLSHQQVVAREDTIGKAMQSLRLPDEASQLSAIAQLSLSLHSPDARLRETAEQILQKVCSGDLLVSATSAIAACRVLASSTGHPMVKRLRLSGEDWRGRLESVEIGELILTGVSRGHLQVAESSIGKLLVENAHMNSLVLQEVSVDNGTILDLDGHLVASMSELQLTMDLELVNAGFYGCTTVAHIALPSGDVRPPRGCVFSGGHLKLSFFRRAPYVHVPATPGDLEWLDVQNVKLEVSRVNPIPPSWGYTLIEDFNTRFRRMRDREGAIDQGTD